MIELTRSAAKDNLETEPAKNYRLPAEKTIVSRCQFMDSSTLLGPPEQDKVNEQVKVKMSADEGLSVMDYDSDGSPDPSRNQFSCGNPSNEDRNNPFSKVHEVCLS